MFLFLKGTLNYNFNFNNNHKTFDESVQLKTVS